MGISNHGIWEKLHFSISAVLAEVKPRLLEEEIERKMEQYRVSVQPFYKQCKRNEVKLEMKLVVGLSPGEITITEAQNSKTRWIVLDRFFIYGHVGCNVALMKGKDVATLMPSRASRPENSSGNQTENRQNEGPDAPSLEQDSSIPPPPPLESPGWYPSQWRNGFPREFSLSEITEITNGLAGENLTLETENKKVYGGILKETPALVKTYMENDERLKSMLMILLQLCHRNIMNLVGYCFTDISRFFIFDFPILGSLENISRNDNTASNLSWKARWYTALEIGGSLRHLHDKCPDGPIAHLSLCSSHVVSLHGCSAMLSNFLKAKQLNVNDEAPCHGNSTVGCAAADEDESLSVDVHDYGMSLMELITGNVLAVFHMKETVKPL
ncbi:hypothetical protein SLA2020_053620 [Shorea laevis]